MPLEILENNCDFLISFILFRVAAGAGGGISLTGATVATTFHATDERLIQQQIHLANGRVIDTQGRIDLVSWLEFTIRLTSLERRKKCSNRNTEAKYQNIGCSPFILK